MKLTKEQLKRIIKEELQKESYGDMFDPYNPEGHPEPNDQPVSLEDVLKKAAEIKKQGGLGLAPKEAIEALWSEYGDMNDEQKALLDKQFPGYDADALERLYDELTGISLRMGDEWSDAYQEGKQKMKLTKEQLQRIIKEELQVVMTEERTWKPGIYGIDSQGRLTDGPFEDIEDLIDHYNRSYGGDLGYQIEESGEWVYSLVHPDKKGDMSLEALMPGLRFLFRNDSKAAASIIDYLEDGLDLETAIELTDEKLSPKELAGLGIEQGLQEET